MIVKGYKGKLTLQEIKEFASQGIYTFNSKCVVGKEHLLYAYKKAEEAFQSEKNIARNFHIEIMLILTGRRQIKDALHLASPENSESFVAISKEDFELPYPKDDNALSCSVEKLKYLGIEIFASMNDKLCDLAFENSALLELER